MYSSFTEKLLNVTKWVLMNETLSIQYLHQHGQILTLIDIEADDHVHSMKVIGGSYRNAIYRYLTKPPIQRVNHHLAGCKFVVNFIQLLHSVCLIISTFNHLSYMHARVEAKFACSTTAKDNHGMAMTQIILRMQTWNFIIQ